MHIKGTAVVLHQVRAHKMIATLPLVVTGTTFAEEQQTGELPGGESAGGEVCLFLSLPP